MKHIRCEAIVLILVLCIGCAQAAETPPFIELKGHEGWVSWASFFSDGKKVLTQSPDNTVRVWDAESGKELTKIDWQTDQGKIIPGMIALSPDGKRVVTPGPHGSPVRIWDTESGEELYGQELSRLGLFEGECQGFLPNSNKIAVTSRNGTNFTRIVDAESGKELHTLKGYTRFISSSSDGKKIATRSWDMPQIEIIHIWDVDSGKELKKFEITGRVSYIYLSPDGKKMIVNRNGGPTHFFDVESGKELELEGYTDTLTYTCFSPEGKKIVARSPFLEKSNSGLRFIDYITRIWDAESGKELYQFENAEVAFSQDGKKMIVTESYSKDDTQNGGDDNKLGEKDFVVRILDSVTGRELKKIAGNTRITFSPDGKKFATNNFVGAALIWDTESGKAIYELKTLVGAVSSLNFSPDGKKIVTTGNRTDDTTARIWTLE